jgi:hypothetical protein
MLDDCNLLESLSASDFVLSCSLWQQHPCQVRKHQTLLPEKHGADLSEINIYINKILTNEYRTCRE